jgi:hypothetical protein
MDVRSYTALKISVRAFAALVTLAFIVPIGAREGGPIGAFVAVVLSLLLYPDI